MGIGGTRMWRGALAVFGIVLLATAATADNRIFVIENSPDGYGVDQCLATGAACGGLIANAYCQSKDFARAASFRRIERSEITSLVTVPAASRTDNLVAIECAP